MTVPQRATRGEYAKTAARRREILGAAVEVFSGSGYRKGSLRDVAERVGLSQAGLLHHYPTKSHLLEAVLARRDEDALELMGGGRWPEGLDLIRALLELARHNATTPELIELHAVVSAEATSPDHPVHDYFVQRSRTTIDLVARAFELARERGELRQGVDPGNAARVFLAAWDGLQIIWLLDRSSIDVAEDLRRYAQSLLTVDL